MFGGRAQGQPGTRICHRSVGRKWRVEAREKSLLEVHVDGEMIGSPISL
jgi:hypothetical protein